MTAVITPGHPALSPLVLGHGEGGVRQTSSQNSSIRWSQFEEDLHSSADQFHPSFQRLFV